MELELFSEGIILFAYNDNKKGKIGASPIFCKKGTDYLYIITTGQNPQQEIQQEIFITNYLYLGIEYWGTSYPVIISEALPALVKEETFMFEPLNTIVEKIENGKTVPLIPTKFFHFFDYYGKECKLKIRLATRFSF